MASLLMTAMLTSEGLCAALQELRTVRSGIMGDADTMVTVHDILDAQSSNNIFKDKAYLMHA